MLNGRSPPWFIFQNHGMTHPDDPYKWLKERLRSSHRRNENRSRVLHRQ